VAASLRPGPWAAAALAATPAVRRQPVTVTVRASGSGSESSSCVDQSLENRTSVSGEPPESDRAEPLRRGRGGRGRCGTVGPALALPGSRQPRAGNSNSLILSYHY
jgi:hypothetical protein